MDKVLWYLIAGTRGGPNRARILRELATRPRNAHQLADTLDLEYNTVRYHIDMLLDHGVVEAGEQDYGKPYFLTDQFQAHWETFETITEHME